MSYLCTHTGKGYMGQVDVVLGETDYQNYAILYYLRRNKITLKLYGECVQDYICAMTL